MGGVGGTADIRSEDEMRYYLDTEFNGSGGALLSFALLREDGAAIYGIMPLPANVEPLGQRERHPDSARRPATLPPGNLGVR